jgi:hypothetical protein
MLKNAKIKKLPNGKYRVLSEKGKNLGTFPSLDKAKNRLRQVEFFKHNADDTNFADDAFIDLTDADEFAYSAIVRKIREKCDKDVLYTFLKMFRQEFDKAYLKKLKEPDKIALQETVIKFNKIHKIRLSKDLVKNAAIAELGSAEDVGKYLSNIVKFIIAKVPQENRYKYIDKLRQKFYNLDVLELSNKDMPESSSMGQAITFIKTVLINHDPGYIKEVISYLVRYL